MLELLKNRRFLPFWLGTAASGYGDNFRRIAMTLWVYAASGGSAIAAAIMTLAEVGPTLILGPIAGTLVDRVDKKAIMAGASAILGACSVAQVVAIYTGRIPIAYGIAAIASSADVFFRTASDSAVPSIVPRDHYHQANSLMVITRQALLVVGPGSAVAVYEFFGPSVSLLLDAFSYFFAAVAALFIGAVAPSATSGSVPPMGYTKSFQDGLKYIFSDTALTIILVLTAMQYMSSGLNGGAMLFFISRSLGKPPADIAWLSTVNGIAQVLVAGYIGALARKAKAYRVLALSAAVASIGATLVASSWSLPILIIGVVITSLGNAPLNISSTTIQQTLVDANYFGRFSAVLSTLGSVAFLSANSAAGYLVDSFNPRLVLFLSASVSIALTILAAFGLAPIIRKQERRAAGLDIVDAV